MLGGDRFGDAAAGVERDLDLEPLRLHHRHKVVEDRVRGPVLVGEMDALFPFSMNSDGSSSASSPDVLA